MMDTKKMGQDMIKLYKTAFDASFNTMMLMQEQMMRLGNICCGQMAGFPEELKKDLTEWTTCYKKSCEDFKKTVDDGFVKMETFIV